MDKEVLNKLLQLVKDSMPDIDMAGADENTRLIEDLGYDSLGLLTLVINVEKEFSVKFNRYYHINTIKDIYDYILTNQKASA